MACQIIFKTTYTYTMTNRNISKSYQMHTGSNQTDTPFFFFHLIIVLLNFRFQKRRDKNPRLDPVGGSKLEPSLLRHFQLSSQNILFCLIKFLFSKVSRPESPTRPEMRIRTGARFTPTFSIIFSKHLFCLIKFSFSKVSQPESPTRPERWIRTGARFTPTFSIIFSKHLFRLFHFRLFNYAETLHLGQTHKKLQLTKCIYQIMPLYTHILMLFIFASFHSTNHLSYHNIHFQCNNSIHNSIYEI